MMEVIFLAVLALIWIIFAAICDLKTKEIPNWLNFSLIFFAMAARFFHSVFSAGNFNFFLQGLIGLGIFFIIENLLYYGKIFGGGDAKLMLALGAILPFSENLIINLEIFASFLFLYLLSGSVYGIVSAVYLSLKNRKKFRREFKIIFRKNSAWSIAIMIAGIFLMIFGAIFSEFLFYSGILVFASPILYIFTKSVDESCMKKTTNPGFLKEGDMLYKDVKIGNRIIRATWNGLTKSEISLIQKRHKTVVIKQGIPFGPVFLISFLLLIYFYFINAGLWNSFW